MTLASVATDESAVVLPMCVAGRAAAGCGVRDSVVTQPQRWDMKRPARAGGVW